ncbi:macro domain-containing protein [Streptomyces sp. SAJ15]|uniref:macro domain-containing protein n=1 Tax=Streptomyces sp. SAJ15 TaxID=2011095 RepID=UPI001184EB79|nr:macro domain-containing protein [Streptomyces sp. SAJ15]TVL91177.1 Appr-1-p processing protein [Streptomyces sp. SAJ15]
MSAEIGYECGDATRPPGPGPKIIAHVCNDAGRWGAGFVVAVSRRWPQPEAAYREWYCGRQSNDFALGAVQLVQTQDDVWVANMIGQHGIRSRTRTEVPVRYEAIDQALESLSNHASALAASVHMPRIGCGLAGGRWERIEPLIAHHLTAQGISVTVYDRP